MLTTSTTSPSRILVVDDDDAVLSSLTEELQPHYNVTPAPSAELALSMLEFSPFDAIISDVRMPGIDGVEFLRRTQKLEYSPVRILMTGYSDEHAIEFANASAGDVLLLHKPWDERLETFLEKLLEQRHTIHCLQSDYGNEKRQRERAELAILRLERLSQLGTLSASIAHELRSPLAFLLSNQQWVAEQHKLLQRYFEQFAEILSSPDERTLKMTQLRADKGRLALPKLFEELHSVDTDALRGLQQLTSLVKEIRGHSAPKSAPNVEVSVSGCIEHAIRLTHCFFKNRIRLEKSLDPVVSTFFGQDGEICQVLINLILNSAEAITDQGSIFIRSYSNGPKVVIEVEDTGPGVPADVVQNLFQPFVTTKASQNGNGLGLAISREIARRNGGDLSYVQRSTGGALFRLELLSPTCLH